jgi:serine protease Do
MSFALPARELLRTADALRHAMASLAGDPGMRLQPLTPELARAFLSDGTSASVVVRVEEGGAAARGGVRVGDVVLGFARTERLEHDAIEARLSATPPGTVLALELWRDGSAHSARLILGAASAEPDQPLLPPAATESRLGLNLAVLRARAKVPAGVYVDTATGSALLAGLERGDRIVAVNGASIGTIDDFDAALAGFRNREVIALLVARGATTAYVPVTRER